MGHAGFIDLIGYVVLAYIGIWECIDDTMDPLAQYAIRIIIWNLTIHIVLEVYYGGMKNMDIHVLWKIIRSDSKLK